MVIDHDLPFLPLKFARDCQDYIFSYFPIIKKQNKNVVSFPNSSLSKFLEIVTLELEMTLVLFPPLALMWWFVSMCIFALWL